MSSSETRLQSISERVRKSFRDDRTILTFKEWFSILLEHPATNLRSSSHYIRDVFDFYGRDVRDLPQGKVDRFKLFDAPWADGDGRVAGQEQVQNELYRLISNFVRDGRVSRLILLHGPNGSAKSTIVRCIQSAMENYSRHTEGALYTYSWVFPSEKIAKGSLGFGERASTTSSVDSYAGLNADQIDARLPCELRDHPIFFIPREERVALIADLIEREKLPRDFVVSRYIMEGDLSPRDRAIYDALLLAHDGDHNEVMRHVQVERFFISGKYGRGVSTVEPQDAVDARAEQLTNDRSILNLPRSLHHVPLFRIWGPLVSANRGLLEYADILKRPIDWLKYLLTTSEEATASLPQFRIDLDELLIASTNEVYLAAFKKNPDWASFKGRMELVAVPYLRRFGDEVEIYESQIGRSSIDKPMAPHVLEVAAMWAVLTRLKKPDKSQFSPPVKSLVERLSPIEKLELYNRGEVPEWCSAQDAKELRSVVQMLMDDGKATVEYEGHRGASAREIRTLILNAAHHPGHRTLTPLAIIDELRELVSDPSVYEFLQVQPQDTFHDHEQFIETVRLWWIDLLGDEVRTSMGMVEEKRYEELLGKYVLHVSHYLKKEKLQDDVTGEYMHADEEMMAEVEASILADGEDSDDFRKALIGQIGAWGLEHAGQSPDYRRLFPKYIEKMEGDYYRERRRAIAKNIVSSLKYLGDGERELNDEDRAIAKHTVETLRDRFGYPPEATAECFAFLLKERYQDDVS